MYHSYEGDEVNNMVALLKRAVKMLIQEDSELLNPDKIPSDHEIQGKDKLNREVHETAINHRLAVYIEHLLVGYGYNDYKVDIEYDRFLDYQKWVQSLENGNKIKIRPDIIVHKRTFLDGDAPHLLIVEAKKYDIITKDRNHVMDIMSDANYRYKFGLLISYYKDPAIISCELLLLLNNSFDILTFEINKSKN